LEKLDFSLQNLATGINQVLKNTEKESKLLTLEAKIQFRVAFSVSRKEGGGAYGE
jgi:hypothetical protein